MQDFDRVLGDGREDAVLQSASKSYSSGLAVRKRMGESGEVVEMLKDLSRCRRESTFRKLSSTPHSDVHCPRRVDFCKVVRPRTLRASQKKKNSISEDGNSRFLWRAMCLTMLSIKVDLPPFSSTKPSLRRFFDRSLLAAIHKGLLFSLEGRRQHDLIHVGIHLVSAPPLTSVPFVLLRTNSNHRLLHGELSIIGTPSNTIC